MGFFKKIFKGVKKVFKKIGKGIKKVAMKIGKVVGKLGIVGQIGLMFILPGVGGLLAKGFGALTSGLLASGSALANGIGTILSTAGKFASTIGNAFSTVTEGISSFIGKVGGKVLEKVGLKAATEGTLTEAFQGWMTDTATDFGKILDPFKLSSEEFAASLIPKPTSATASMTAEKTSLVETNAGNAVDASSMANKNDTFFKPTEPVNTDFMNIESNLRQNAVADTTKDIVADQVTEGGIKGFLEKDRTFAGTEFTIAEELRGAAIDVGQAKIKEAVFGGPEEQEEQYGRVDPVYSYSQPLQRSQDIYQQNGVYVGATPVNMVASAYGQSLQAGMQYVSPIRRGGS
jgi:hypothetical protein